MRSLRSIITETLEEMKDSNLESEAERQRIADKIIAKRSDEVCEVLKNVGESFNRMDKLLRNYAG